MSTSAATYGQVVSTGADLFSELERICETVIRKHAVENDRRGSFPTQCVEALSTAGLMGALSAKEVGGLALGLGDASNIVRRIANECGSTAMILCMHYCGAVVIENYGSTEVRCAIAKGDHLSTLAFSEAGSRSHFWVPISTAQREGEAIILNARKSWITSASHATAYVWSSKPLVAEGFSTIWLVPRESSGIQVQGPFDGLGLRANDSSPVSADNVRVPESAILGHDGGGLEVMMHTILPVFSVLASACSVGLMEAAVQRTVEHASGLRYEHMDSSLVDLPTVRAYIARMRIKTDQTATLLSDTISAIEARRSDATLRVLECKAAAGEASGEVLDIAMRVCGGGAFRKDVGVERYFRDTRAAGVMAPTTDVLYDFLGKAICGMDLF